MLKGSPFNFINMVTAKFIKCDNCKKIYTQTTYKKKKSLAVCPHCKTKKQKV